jgi:hypothetical protein
MNVAQKDKRRPRRGGLAMFPAVFAPSTEGTTFAQTRRGKRAKQRRHQKLELAPLLEAILKVHQSPEHNIFRRARTLAP